MIVPPEQQDVASRSPVPAPSPAPLRRGLPSWLRAFLAALAGAAVASAAVAFGLARLGGSYAQLRLGLRGGFQFSSGDSLTREDCDYTREDRVPCSRVTTEAYVASSFLGLMRLHVAGVVQPSMHEGQSLRFAVRPMVGVQLNSPF